MCLIIDFPQLKSLGISSHQTICIISYLPKTTAPCKSVAILVELPDFKHISIRSQNDSIGHSSSLGCPCPLTITFFPMMKQRSIDLYKITKVSIRDSAI